jgi:membrane protein DedA with SNARE-associated domain
MVAEITALITAYKYWAIVPFALFEAPLMSIIIGFFAATGQLNLFLAFGIVVLGDFTGDTVLYIAGRWGRPLFEKVGLHLNLSSEHVQFVLAHFERRDRRAIVISKLIHGVGFTGLVVAGSIKVPYRRFAATCILVTISQSAVLAAIGMFSGKAYNAFAFYLGYFDIVVTAALLLGIFVFYKSLLMKISKKDAKG